MKIKYIILILIFTIGVFICLYNCLSTITRESFVSKESEILKNHNIIVCGLVRDSAKTVLKNLKNLDQITKYFDKSEFIIVENDSKDTTSEILKSWGENRDDAKIISKKLDHIINPQLSPNIKGNYDLSKRRFEKMAAIRNIYMNNLPEFSNLDNTWIMMVDLDLEIIQVTETVNSLTSLANNPNWDLICSNGLTKNCKNYGEYCKFKRPIDNIIGRSYDSLATRFLDDPDHPTFVINDKSQSENIKEKWRQHEARAWSTITSPDQGLLKVKSCFGGLAVYKANKINKLRYSGNDCEHMSINLKLDNIFIDSGFIVYYD